MTMTEVLGTISDLGVIGLLAIAFYGGAKGVWVWGWAYREKVRELERQLEKAEEDRDEWKILALEATDIGKRVVNVAEKVTTR